MSRSAQKRNPNVSYYWPVPILSKRFGQFQQVNPDLLDLFYDYKLRNPAGEGSVYSSPDNLHEEIRHPSLDKLTRFITDGVFEIAAEVNRPYWQKATNIRVNLTGIWFQITNDYAFHETHIHGNCSWSGVYYVRAGSSSKQAQDRGANGMPNGITRFYGPHMEYTAGGHGDLGNFYLQDHAMDSYPEDGRLVVFPSHLKHMVFPYKGEEDRVIVSFHAQVFGESEMRYGYSFA